MGMGIQGSVSRVLKRRKYTRVQETEFVVKSKRLKVAQLQDVIPNRSTNRIKFRWFRIRLPFRVSPSSLMARLKAQYVTLMGPSSSKKSRSKQAEKLRTPSRPAKAFNRSGSLRSSSNDVVDEAWFRETFRKSIALGRLQLPL